MTPPEPRLTIAEERALRSEARRDRPKAEPPLLRFDRTERALHWVNASLFGILMLTGAALYAGPVSTLVGNRGLVRFVHVYSGLALPIPLLMAILGRRGARCAPTWAGSTAGRATTPAGSGAVSAAGLTLGKFNPGQKLNADLHRRRRHRDARDRVDHEVVRAVPPRLAHRRHLRARLVRIRHLDRRDRPHLLRAARRRRARQHARAAPCRPPGRARRRRSGTRSCGPNLDRHGHRHRARRRARRPRRARNESSRRWSASRASAPIAAHTRRRRHVRGRGRRAHARRRARRRARAARRRRSPLRRRRVDAPARRAHRAALRAPRRPARRLRRPLAVRPVRTPRARRSALRARHRRRQGGRGRARRRGARLAAHAPASCRAT